MAALKFGHLVLEKTKAEVYSFYIDLRTIRRTTRSSTSGCWSEGMHFVRGQVAEVTDAARVAERGRQARSSRSRTRCWASNGAFPSTWSILMGALEPQADAEEIGRKCNISCSRPGWFTERHPKLDPVATMTDGVFVAGACQGPKDIPASVAQGAAAAARVQGMIAKGTVMIEPIMASVDEESCSGCRVCNALCPYHAIDFDDEKPVSRVNTALCKGCGTCVAACPAGAMRGPFHRRADLRRDRGHPATMPGATRRVTTVRCIAPSGIRRRR